MYSFKKLMCWSNFRSAFCVISIFETYSSEVGAYFQHFRVCKITNTFYKIIKLAKKMKQACLYAFFKKLK